MTRLDKIKSIIKNIEKSKKAASGKMKFGLITFQVVFVVIVALAVGTVLAAMGVFSDAEITSMDILTSEQSHGAKGISRDMVKLSTQSMEFSGEVSRDIEKNIAEMGLTSGGISANPQIIEGLLEKEAGKVVELLEKGKCSGAFIILDATVNPDIPDSENSKACIWIKNMEPNIISSSNMYLYMFRGSADIIKKLDISMHSLWEMEADVKDVEFFHKSMNTEGAAPEDKRTYFWNTAYVGDLSSKLLICSVPLVDSQGNIFGVCGTEVSAMLFKLMYAPDHGNLSGIFSMLSPMKEGQPVIEESLMAGFLMSIPDKEAYEAANYTKVSSEVQLYPKDSPFYHEKWEVSTLVPNEYILKTEKMSSMKLAGFLLLLMLFFIAVAVLYSKNVLRYVDIVVSEAAQEGAVKAAPESLGEFLKGVESLSAAERAVYDLFMEGRTSKEIADILHLSINTIKTHSKRIYMKLNVSSRKELLLYRQMMADLNIPFKGDRR